MHFEHEGVELENFQNGFFVGFLVRILTLDFPEHFETETNQFGLRHLDDEWKIFFFSKLFLDLRIS